MRKLGLFLTALAIVAFGVATSHAALISLYEFEDGAGTAVANSVTGQAGGTIVGAGSLSAGKIGDGGYLNASVGSHGGVVTTGNTVFTPEAWNSNDYGFWSGTWSTWVMANYNPDHSPHTNSFYVTYYNESKSFRSGYVQYNFPATPPTGYLFKENVRKLNDPASGNYPYQHSVALNDALTALTDGEWHLLTYKYNNTTGAAGTGSGTLYINGEVVTAVENFGSITSSLAYPAISKSAIYAIDVDGLYPWLGAGDDFANWNVQLSDAEVKALYNLGDDDDLNYGAKLATELFDLYAGDVGDQDEIGGLMWEKVDGGLGEVAGAIVDFGGGIKGVNLGGEGGAGVKIVPEPGTISLLAVALGLLLFAWKKRK